MGSKKKYTQEELANLHYTPKKKSTRLIDLTGKTFYEWKVLEQAPPTEDGKTMWKCRCSCGNVYIKLGMKTSITNITSPNYRWVSLYGSDVITRYKAQKQNLLDMGLGIYGDIENEIMTNLGYLKVYDCGNLKFTWQSSL